MITYMGKDDDSGKEEAELWRFVTRDVRKLEGPALTPPLKLRKRIRVSPDRALPILPVVTLPEGGGIDRKTEARVRKGEIKIEARLDMHGMTLDTARQELLRFIRLSYAADKRCILAITGKGRAAGSGSYSLGAGAIKREFPLWLDEADMKPYILSVSAAQPKHGGSGAYYIYLRKKR